MLVGPVTDYVLRRRCGSNWALESSPQGEGHHDLSRSIGGTVRTECDLSDVLASLACGNSGSHFQLTDRWVQQEPGALGWGLGRGPSFTADLQRVMRDGIPGLCSGEVQGKSSRL